MAPASSADDDAVAGAPRQADRSSSTFAAYVPRFTVAHRLVALAGRSDVTPALARGVRTADGRCGGAAVSVPAGSDAGEEVGRERISSQEISAYTNINATQIRRDLSAFGKFGKRGVGYNIESLLGEIRKILRTQGQHNIALIGAGRLGRAIASSPIFAEHGIKIAAVFDTDGDKVGRSVGHVTVSPYDSLAQSVRDKNMLIGVMAVPASAAQPVANDLIEAGVKIIFNYSEALLDVPRDVQLHTSNPAVELLTALYFHLM